MAKNDESKDLDKVDGVTIKKEKVTPPPSPTTSKSFISIADTALTERKPVTQPIQSSSEILADLFKVFNAAPPTIEDTSPVEKRRKVKKEKKSKKRKKESRRDSDSDAESKSSSQDTKSRKEKKRKVKKEKKHKKSKEDNASADDKKPKTNNSVAVKKEPTNDHRPSTSSTATTSDVKTASADAGPSISISQTTTATKESDDKRKQFDGIQVSVTKNTDGATSKRKIVIKSLVNSDVFKESSKDSERKESERKDKERDEHSERKRRRDGHNRRTEEQRSEEKRLRRETAHPRSRESSLSLSDEETYLRERDRESRRMNKVNDTNDLRLIFFII